MQLTSISIPVRDWKSAGYFRTVLGLPVETADETSRVKVGTTRLELRIDPSASDGVQHLAFTIPTGKFRAAADWLADRAELLADLSGQNEFQGPPGWNSTSVYFDGPEQWVLELIERRDVVNGTEDAFSPADLLCISEVGVAVPDVYAAARALQAVGIDSYGGVPSDTFAATGDADGLLILVPAGRTWFPTTDRRAGPSAITIKADGHPGRHDLGASVLDLNQVSAAANHRLRDR